MCTHICNDPSPQDIEKECWVKREEFSHCEDCRICDSGHGVLSKNSEEKEVFEFAANEQSLKTYLGSTRREQLQTKSAKLSFKMDVSSNDRTLLQKMILNSITTNLKQEFQDDFISVQITSFSFLETATSNNTLNGPQAASYYAIGNSTNTNSTIGNSTAVISTDQSSTTKTTGNLQRAVFVHSQANFARNASVTNVTVSKVQTSTENELKLFKFIHNISSAFKVVPPKSKNTKYIVAQVIIFLVTFSIAGFSIHFRWKKFTEEKDLPKQLSAGF